MVDVALLVSVFVLSFVAGYLLISRVPARFHTPLMSMTNAISAVTVLGGIVIFTNETDVVPKLLGAFAVAAAAFNAMGGFAITDRMLRLFGRKEG